jgi:hypothetical protein
MAKKRKDIDTKVKGMFFRKGDKGKTVDTVETVDTVNTVKTVKPVKQVKTAKPAKTAHGEEQKVTFYLPPEIINRIDWAWMAARMEKMGRLKKSVFVAELLEKALKEIKV